MLEITKNDGRCFLHYTGSNSPIRLALTPPCYFLRDEAGEPQKMGYVNAGITATLIVVGNTISETTRAEWGLAETDLCGEKAQGVMITDDGVVVAEKVLEGKVLCRDYGADEKDFWYFAPKAVAGLIGVQSLLSISSTGSPVSGWGAPTHPCIFTTGIPPACPTDVRFTAPQP